MPKKIKHQTSLTPSHWHDILHKEFEGESDRACVILAATLLDAALETLLKACLSPSISGTDSLFDGSNAPLGTFSARIDLSYRLGLISPQLTRDLHLIRRIRNDFAHNVAGCSFDDTSVRDRILELSRSNRINERHQSWKEAFGDTPKGHFQIVVSWMQWHLRAITNSAQSFSVASNEWGYSDEWGRLDEEGEQVSTKK